MYVPMMLKRNDVCFRIMVKLEAPFSYEFLIIYNIYLSFIGPPSSPTLTIMGDDQGIIKLKIELEENEVEKELKTTGFVVQYMLASESWDDASTQEFQIGMSMFLCIDLY